MSYRQKFIRYIFSSLFTPLLDFILKLLKHTQRRTQIYKLEEINKAGRHLKPLGLWARTNKFSFCVTIYSPKKITRLASQSSQDTLNILSGCANTSPVFIYTTGWRERTRHNDSPTRSSTQTTWLESSSLWTIKDTSSTSHTVYN